MHEGVVIRRPAVDFRSPRPAAPNIPISDTFASPIGPRCEARFATRTPAAQPSNRHRCIAPCHRSANRQTPPKPRPLGTEPGVLQPIFRGPSRDSTTHLAPPPLPPLRLEHKPAGSATDRHCRTMRKRPALVPKVSLFYLQQLNPPHFPHKACRSEA